MRRVATPQIQDGISVGSRDWIRRASHLATDSPHLASGCTTHTHPFAPAGCLTPEREDAVRERWRAPRKLSQSPLCHTPTPSKAILVPVRIPCPCPDDKPPSPPPRCNTDSAFSAIANARDRLPSLASACAENHSGRRDAACAPFLLFAAVTTSEFGRS